MRKNGPTLNGVPELLLSHPVDGQRIAEARARTLQMPRRGRAQSDSYRLIRERLRVLATGREDLRGYYAGLLKNGVREPWVHYGMALADIKAGDAQAAVTKLRALMTENPNLALLHSALGQAQIAAGDDAGALSTFAQANVLFPRNVPVAVRYAETLLSAGRATQAHQLLLDLFNHAPPTPDQIQLTARAASSAGDTGDAYYYMAEYHLASGDVMLANQQLELALGAPGITEVQRKRFVARRDEIRDFLREQKQRGRRG
jgi:predicted Zn-dependent protease